MKVGSRTFALIAASVLLVAVVATNLQQVSAFGFVERQQIGEFKKLTGDFVQKVINKQKSPNSESVGQFRILTGQFERDVIDAIVNDHLSLIPGIVSEYPRSITTSSPDLANGPLGEDMWGGVWPRGFEDILQTMCLGRTT